jgi:hypothetical protein
MCTSTLPPNSYYTDTPPTEANSNVPESPPQNGTEYTYGQLLMYTNGSAVKIQTPTHWNLIASNMTAPPPVHRPAVFFSHLHLIALSLPQGKIWHAFQ